MLDVRDLNRGTREMSSQTRDKSRFVVHGTQHQQYHLSQTRNGKPVRVNRPAAGLFATCQTRTSKASLCSQAQKRLNDRLSANRPLLAKRGH